MMKYASSGSLINSPVRILVLGSAQMNYAGIEHHRQYSQATWLDEKAKVVKSGRVVNRRPQQGE